MGELLRLDRYVDAIIPAAVPGCTRCKENSSIPSSSAALASATSSWTRAPIWNVPLAVIDNAEVQRPPPRNALDTLLVHEKIAARCCRSRSLMNERQ